MGSRTTGASPSPSVSPTLQFSTEDVSSRYRIDAWREVIGRAIIKFKVEPTTNERFHGEITLCGLPGLHLNKGEAGGMRLLHTPALLESDDLIMNIGLGGSHLVQQHGRELTVGIGDAVLMTGAEPMVHSFSSAGKLFTFCMPRTALAAMVGNLDTIFARPIRNDTEALRLLIDYADVVQNMPAIELPEARHLVATHMHDLIALTVGANRDAAEIAKERGLRAARLRAIKNDVVVNLHRTGLSVDELARRQRITPRYVQMMFESEGTTFTQFLLTQRLAKGHRILTDPRFLERSITSVAFDVGFGDLSYFDRVFRRRYGSTPSELRTRFSDNRR
jgi:AraC-like DNA-binding protein